MNPGPHNKTSKSPPEDLAAFVLEYSNPSITLRCIESLANTNIKHIFIRDNSADNGFARATLLRAIDANPALLERVTILGDNRNLGFSAGMNAVLAEVGKKMALRHVLLINNDATIDQNGPAVLLKVLTNNARLAMVAPEFLDAQKKNTAMLYYNAYTATMSRKKHPGSFAFLSGCCVLVDLKKTGLPLFDEKFFMYGEDVALSLGIHEKGFEMDTVASVLVEHIGSASSVTGSTFYEYHVARGHLLLTSRIAGSWLHSIFLWPPRLTSLVVRGFIRSVRSGSFTPLVALWRALFALGPAS